MALIVQKFGGSSVASLECIENVADKIVATQALGHQVVVVLSAMSGQTDRLLDMARKIMSIPPARELDVLLASGEQVSIALLAMALTKRGVSAKTYLGAQIPILTNNIFTKARIMDIDRAKLKKEIAQHTISIIAGFQGIDPDGNLTTLGRGGSDTTAVAIAAAIEAKECQIFTDVDGVYTCDPKMVKKARRLETITFEEMLEMASLGSKVLQIRAVEFAGKYNVPVRVLSTFTEGNGTLITFEEKGVEQPIISGIAFSRDEAKITINGLPNTPGMVAKVLGTLADANIDVDMINQYAISAERIAITFTVHRRDYESVRLLAYELQNQLGAQSVDCSPTVAKISLVGVGIRSHVAIPAQMFKTLADENINIQLISTSEIKVSVVVDEKYIELAVRALHTSFGLDFAPAI